VDPLGLVGPLTLPPRLLVRALDDLHTMAVVVRDVAARLETLQERADSAVALLARIESVGEQALAMGQRVETQAEDLLKLGEQFDRLGVAVLEQGRVLERTARDLAKRGVAVTDALPTLERAVEIVEPLEGAVERLGRIADLLPGGGARRVSPTARRKTS
jgi:hypothetical protein